MKYLLTAMLVILASCGSMPTNENTNFRSVQVGYGQGDFDEASVDSSHNASVQFLYQVSDDGDETDDRNVARGLVSDISINGSMSRFDSLGGTNIDLDIDTIDVRPGLRYYFDTGSRLFQPFIGAALVGQYAHMETQIAGDDSDTFGLGGAARIGIESAISEHGRLGLMYDHTWMTHDTDAGDADLDGGVLMLTLGWSF